MAHNPFVCFFRVVLGGGRGFEIHWQVLGLAWPGLQPSLPVVGGVEGIESVPLKGQGRVMCGEQNVWVTSLPWLYWNTRVPQEVPREVRGCLVEELLVLLGEEPGVWGRPCCPVLSTGSSVCVLRSFSLLGMDLLFSDETFPSQGVVLSPSFLSCSSYPQGRE